jgi:hypothetical protein
MMATGRENVWQGGIMLRAVMEMESALIVYVFSMILYPLAAQ